MLSTLKNRHLGETCIILCNGPSLNAVDFSIVRNTVSIALNKIFLGFDKFGFYPNYYVAVNEKVLRQSTQEILALNCVKFLSNRCSDLFSNDALTHILNTAKPPGRFCSNIVEGAEEGGTVTYVALQIAYFLGFKRVVIVGMDHKFSFTGLPNETAIMNGEDVNHFTPAYFGGGQSWDNPDLQRSEESYRIARAIFESEGREIIDATHEGKCTIFRKSPLNELF